MMIARERNAPEHRAIRRHVNQNIRRLEHDAEKWVPVSRLREARGTVRRLA